MAKRKVGTKEDFKLYKDIIEDVEENMNKLSSSFVKMKLFIIEMLNREGDNNGE